ncbi:MAG TPA: DUF2203 domain-containing protein [Bryobacteraceae bacterium]|jgi:hypothetical protein|nr:DUF2203 domain-containing protein [Bryobacteraceae bacterium]
MAKRFTVWEAQRMLPQIGDWMREAVALKSQYDEAERAVQALTARITMMGGIIANRERAAEDKARRDTAGQRLRAILENFEQSGVLVKDLEKGLADFPTLFRGEEVYLCWKLDEASIQFWHGTHEGFAGRKAIDQDFLDHHEGEQAN